MDMHTQSMVACEYGIFDNVHRLRALFLTHEYFQLITDVCS